jgi:formylglycine-generating enzyme required for sulfatase activity
MDFCAWDTVGGTLPTEAQWEFAARGPMNRPWPWVGPDSAAPDNRVCWNRYSPTPLGTCMEEDAAYAMGTTPDGVWHLVGNVWEWTRDWYAPYTDTTCWNGQARTDPLCTNSANGFRSIRGGSWLFNDALVVRSGARIDGPRTIRGSDVGFRCAGAAR